MATNDMITRRGVQIPCNRVFQALGLCRFALAGVIWLRKPPFTGMHERRSGT